MGTEKLKDDAPFPVVRGASAGGDEEGEEDGASEEAEPEDRASEEGEPEDDEPGEDGDDQESP
ncbi:hypothetical protein [Sorangium sp. So ce426]|uniref:hypothetical protein n=1 Tax=unclassified Sorangium TaxID=2621164 RepID=UPI003F5B1FB6